MPCEEFDPKIADAENRLADAQEDPRHNGPLIHRLLALLNGLYRKKQECLQLHGVGDLVCHFSGQFAVILEDGPRHIVQGVPMTADFHLMSARTSLVVENMRITPLTVSGESVSVNVVGVGGGTFNNATKDMELAVTLQISDHTTLRAHVATDASISGFAVKPDGSVRLVGKHRLDNGPLAGGHPTIIIDGKLSPSPG